MGGAVFGLRRVLCVAHGSAGCPRRDALCASRLGLRRGEGLMLLMRRCTLRPLKVRSLDPGWSCGIRFFGPRMDLRGLARSPDECDRGDTRTAAARTAGSTAVPSEAHNAPPNSCRMRSCAKMRLQLFWNVHLQIIGLKVPWNEHLQKIPGAGGSIFHSPVATRDAPLSRFLCPVQVCGTTSHPANRHPGLNGGKGKG